MDEPEALRLRPHHGRFPIPYVTHVDAQGVPDFKVQDDEKRREVGEHRLCQLCGFPLGKRVTFIGFPRSCERGIFGEPPAHRDCLDYALEICPWLAGAGWSGNWRRAAAEVDILPRPGGDVHILGIWTCREFWVVPDDERTGGVKYRAGDPVEPIEPWSRVPDG